MLYTCYNKPLAVHVTRNTLILIHSVNRGGLTILQGPEKKLLSWVAKSLYPCSGSFLQSPDKLCELQPHPL